MTTHTDALPVVTITAAHVGPLGLDLGDDAELGGGSEPRGTFIPVLTVNWLDDRETCDRVHDFVFFETPPADLTTCPAFVEGAGHYCRRAGPAKTCAFLEGPDAPIWAKARVWKRTFYRDEEGQARVAYFFDPDDRHPEGAPLPEEGEVAR